MIHTEPWQVVLVPGHFTYWCLVMDGLLGVAGIIDSYCGSFPHSLLSTSKFSILVGGLDHFLFFHILGIIIPTDFHIFQMGSYTTTQ